MENPLINRIQQVALVVRDLDKTIADYTEKLGIGPWWVSLYGPPRLADMRIRGAEVP